MLAPSVGSESGSAANAPVTIDARRGPWPIFGFIAGVAGMVGSHTFQLMDPKVKQAGVEAVYAALGDRLLVTAGASVGFLAILALVAFSVGYLRFLESRLHEKNLWVAAMRMGFTASIGALIITFSFKAIFAVGMPGGIDEAIYTRTDVAVLHLLNDQLQWIGWWGVVIAMICTAGASLQARALPRWIGWLSAILSGLSLVWTLGLTLPFSAGLVAQPWLIIASIGLHRYRNRVPA